MHRQGGFSCSCLGLLCDTDAGNTHQHLPVVQQRHPVAKPRGNTHFLEQALQGFLGTIGKLYLFAAATVANLQ